MARRRDPARSDELHQAHAHLEVPAELLDNDSPAWSDQATFRRWIATHLGTEVADRDAAAIERLGEPARWNSEICDRIRYARTSWATAHGIGSDDLEALGVAPIRALERARLRAKARAVAMAI